MTNGLRIKPAVIISLFAMSAFSAAAAEEPAPNKKGSFSAVFEQYSPLSDTAAISSRIGVSAEPGRIQRHHYDIKKESFEMYVPDCYDSNTPFGLIVWIPAGPGGPIETYQGSKELMDKHKLIWVAANNSGNKEDTYKRRIPLALDAAYNVRKLYNIDPNRIYVGGISGGGRVASRTAFHHSDVYAGGIFVIGADYWMDMPVSGKIFRASFPQPQPSFLLRAKKFGRYVLLTGDNDVNMLEMRTYYQRGYSKFLNNVLYLQVPGMGHQMPPPDELDKALDYVDNHSSQ